MRKGLSVLLALVLCMSFAGVAMTGGALAQDPDQCDADERQSGSQDSNQDCEAIVQNAEADNDASFWVNQENEVEQENEIDADERQSGSQDVEDNEQYNVAYDVDQDNDFNNNRVTFSNDADIDQDADIDDEEDEQDN